MMICQDILEDNKENSRQFLKSCKKIESSKLVFPEYSHIIQKQDMACVLIYLHF